jgi:serine/threonine-protein kinase
VFDFDRERFEHAIGREYQIVRELGRGAMGVVYLARDLTLHRLVAIKVLRPELANSDEGRERFRREARMMARLGHPSIVPVHAFGESGDFVYIVMKYVHGESLAQRLQRAGRLSAEETCRILAELALALDYAHREGVVHRDLKAENVLLERSTGLPVLTDFGVAMLRSVDPAPADAHLAFGTPHYMSPEQVAGELDVDGRSDIYALGVLGYAMLSGRLPFDGRSFAEIAARQIAQSPAPLASLTPSAPAALVEAIERCLRKDPSARWRYGRDLYEALARVRHHASVRSRLSSLVSRVRARLRARLDAKPAPRILYRVAAERGSPVSSAPFATPISPPG